jgi:hypothetical protein
MCGERGQATVEWIGIVLVVAIALAAAARLAPRGDNRTLATTLVHSITCAARDRCGRAQVVGTRSDKRPEPQPPEREGFSVPLLLPRPGQARPRTRLRVPRAPAVVQRARRGAGHAWRRAWYACLVYERFRYALLHPESRFPGYAMPPAEVLRIANDCISPVDMIRDWPLLTDR